MIRMSVNRILPLLLLLVFFTSCARKYKVEGSSSVTSLDGKMLFLKTLQNGQWVAVDSAEVIHGLFSMKGPVDSVKKGSWQQKYLTDFDKYVSKCRYCLNSGLDLPDEPLFTDYVPDLIPVEEELNQESAAAGMTLEEYIKKEYLFK